MAAPAYFVSDLHLDPERPAVIEAFERFLEERRDAEALYILGDLFEFWVGDDDESELIDRVAHALRPLQRCGTGAVPDARQPGFPDRRALCEPGRGSPAG
jgi:UDP-2,3-diacylglucosamine hydrolase